MHGHELLPEASGPERPVSGGGPPDTDRDRLFESLPPRSKRVLALVADGLGDADIAQQLEEDEVRIGGEIQGLLTELGFESRAQAALYMLNRSPERTEEEQEAQPPPFPVPKEVREDTLYRRLVEGWDGTEEGEEG